MPPKRVYKKKYISKKKKYTPKKKTQVPVSIKRYVKRAVNRTEEVKTVVTTLSDLQSGIAAQIRPYVQDPGCGLISLTEAMDTIQQGVGQGDRIGNKIRLKRNMLKGYLYAINGGLTGGNPTNVTMYIGRLKSTLLTPITATLAQLFQAGDTVFAPTDNNLSSLYQINRNSWNVYYRRTFKIGGATSSSTNAIPANNDYKALVKFSINLSKWLPKTINYNDASSISTNAGLYMWFTISNYNDEPITSLYIPQVQYVAINEFSYTDA